MWLRTKAYFARHGPKKAVPYIRRNLPYLALLLGVVAPMLAMAIGLAGRVGLLPLTHGAPTSEQVKTFGTLIVGGLATAATMFGALITRAHNIRERRRLQLQAVLESLKSLPEGDSERCSGVVSAMVVLGQERIALRVLEPMWKSGKLDAASATWVIGQVLGDRADFGSLDGDQPDQTAIIEASVLLLRHAERGELAPPEGGQYFPGGLHRNWNRTLPPQAKTNILASMADFLLSRPRLSWIDGQELPKFPVDLWLRCADADPHPIVRSSAATLLKALIDCWKEHLDENPKIQQKLKEIDKVLSKRRTWRGKQDVSYKIDGRADDISQWNDIALRPRPAPSQPQRTSLVARTHATSAPSCHRTIRRWARVVRAARFRTVRGL